jgi:hypothetical protein
VNKKLIPLFLVLSVLFLTGCGLTSLLPGSGDSDNADTAEVMTDEAPMDEESNMDEPTEDVMPEPAVEDPAVDMASNCYHPLFPISEDAYWQYQVSTNESYTLTLTDVTEDSFTMTQNFDDSEVLLTVDWFCSDEGLLQGNFAQVDIIDASEGEDDPEFNFETLSWEGETLPSKELIEVGYEWTAIYKLGGEMDMEGMTSSIEATVTIDYVIAAIEEVIVPAGTFPEAYRIDSQGIVSMVMDFDGTSMPMSGVDFGSSSWYVEDVGLVKSADSFTSMSSEMELIDTNLVTD